jgi:phosphoserine phosphatase RsbU/P
MSDSGWHRTILSGVRELVSHVQLGLKGLISPPDSGPAQEIQVRLLPRETPQLAGFEIACAWQPSSSVSGDYFDVLALSETKAALCIADVSGKGVAAALLMSNLQAAVKTFAQDGVSPAALCAKVNQTLCDNIAPGRFVTMFYGVLNGRNRTLEYESAGHCWPLIVHSDGTVNFLDASSGVLGLFSHWTYSDHVVKLAAGDVLVVMTKGVLAAENAKGEEFGYRRLIDAVLASRAEGADGIRKNVVEDVMAFCNGQPQDDISMIVVAVD